MSPPLLSSGVEPLIKKRKKKNSSLVPSQTQPTIPIPSIPDDLLLICFARTSRLHYTTLSLVSKRFRSLLTSPDLYNTRSLLGRTESCLYVCLNFPPYTNSQWFTLCRKPNPTLTNNNNNKKYKKKQSVGENLLVPIPVRDSPRAHRAGVVSIGSSIYTIGGPINDDLSSSKVYALDCRSHVWDEGPSMNVERSYPTVNVYNGNIYVAGGCKDYDSTNWMEVFNPKTETWEHMLCPLAERFIDGGKITMNAVFQGRMYLYGGLEGFVYTPNEDRWTLITECGTTGLFLGWAWLSYCVIDNVLYTRGSWDDLNWFDYKKQRWMVVKGLKGLPKFPSYGSVKMADYGGKLAVLWTSYYRASGYKETRIWCAVIVLERLNSSSGGNDEIWGTVECVDPVITVPNSFKFECALSVVV